MIDLMQKAVEQARKDYGEACGGHEDWFIADACARVAMKCVDTAISSCDRQMEIMQSKVDELQEDYEAEQERNTKLIELNDLLKTTLSACRTQIHYLNTHYCKGQSESAKMAIQSIDRIL